MNEEDVEIYTPDHVLVLDDGLYNVALWNPENNINQTTAYLKDDYYYLYRDTMSSFNFDRSPGLKPGIYFIEDRNEFRLVEVETEEDRIKYYAKDKIKNLQPGKIVEAINNGEAVLEEFSPKQLHELYQIRREDDILKRLIKTIFNTKGISIEECKDRFTSRTAQFNFKQQVTSSDKDMSWKLLKRALEATGTKVTLVVEDDNPNNPVGKPLTDPIRISDGDTYEL